jgi:HAD superfamily hydrolase (TIGR01509 family)
MVDVVLIELEGVVFETQALRQECAQLALAAHGIDLPAAPMIIDDVVLADLVASTADRLFSARLMTSGVAVRAGARTFVEQAAARTRLGVVTRMLRRDAESLLRLSGLADAPTVVVCADDVVDPKPSPEGYRLAMSRLHRQRGSEPAGVIALENDASGIRGARAAGVRCIAIGPVEPHIAMEADAYVASLDDQSPQSLDTLSMPGRERVQ